ncbi:hypothetical protein OG252_00315 [Streptomyces sp. NBC_01352]|nr:MULTISPECIES: hypothetical protein [unclassified Streptomyces]MCX4706970.1 hypothetical protein [Streptomyces sp. NBC_01373]
MQLTIDTQTDTYEQAIEAVRAAYGLNPTAEDARARDRRTIT